MELSYDRNADGTWSMYAGGEEYRTSHRTEKGVVGETIGMAFDYGFTLSTYLMNKAGEFGVDLANFCGECGKPDNGHRFTYCESCSKKVCGDPGCSITGTASISNGIESWPEKMTLCFSCDEAGRVEAEELVAAGLL